MKNFKRPKWAIYQNGIVVRKYEEYGKTTSVDSIEQRIYTTLSGLQYWDFSHPERTLELREGNVISFNEATAYNYVISPNLTLIANENSASYTVVSREALRTTTEPPTRGQNIRDRFRRWWSNL